MWIPPHWWRPSKRSRCKQKKKITEFPISQYGPWRCPFCKSCGKKRKKSVPCCRWLKKYLIKFLWNTFIFFSQIGLFCFDSRKPILVLFHILCDPSHLLSHPFVRKCGFIVICAFSYVLFVPHRLQIRPMETHVPFLLVLKIKTGTRSTMVHVMDVIR